MKAADTESPDLDPAGMCALWGDVWPWLEKTLAEVPPDARRFLALRFLEGHGYAAMGVRLGMNAEAVRQRTDQALLALRTALAHRKITRKCVTKPGPASV